MSRKAWALTFLNDGTVAMLPILLEHVFIGLTDNLDKFPIICPFFQRYMGTWNPTNNCLVNKLHIVAFLLGFYTEKTFSKCIAQF